MSLTPLEIQKMRFSQKMRGYDADEVNDFLTVVADELAGRLAEVEKLEREVNYFRHRLEEAEKREHQLQETLLRAQKVSDEITSSAEREARLLIKEAEMTADRIVQQAVDQAAKIEAKITELRASRRELQMKLKGTVDLFHRVLDDDMEEERSTATVRTLRRKDSKESSA